MLNLVLDRSDKERVARAHDCVDRLFEEWARCGVYPYRVGIQYMEHFIKPEDIFLEDIVGAEVRIGSESHYCSGSV